MSDGIVARNFERLLPVGSGLEVDRFGDSSSGQDGASGYLSPGIFTGTCGEVLITRGAPSG
jgi:hypothetical protein